ncbi:MAG: DNA alkylation repair protein [Gammaproteobacteria bacterium]|nr:DNA alkylation repair protein [Gammaproteobacteria bacterium]
MLRIPDAPKSIQKGIPLKNVLGIEAIHCLAKNISTVYPAFRNKEFQKEALKELDSLEFMDRGIHIAKALRNHLPDNYEKAIEIILASLTPPNTETEGLGLAVLFYHPHGCFVSEYGLDKNYNKGIDPFDVSMKAHYELTKRNTSEFSIRPFLINEQKRTLAILKEWTKDPDPHVRRLCSEGARSRLPWAPRISSFIKNPKPVLPILKALKNDNNLYVRRSVANNFGDIAKDHPEIVYEIFEQWLDEPTREVKWLIRHALRHPAKKGDKTAQQLRVAAK